MSGNWKNKMLNHEQTPPKSVWDSIAKKLDEKENEHVPGFAKKLETFEATPPTGIWAAINNELDKEDQPIQITAAKNKSKIIYWRIAAAVAILLVIGTVLFNADKQVHNKKELATNTIPVKNESPVVINTSTEKNNIPVNDTVLKNRLPFTIKHQLPAENQAITLDPNSVADNYVKVNDVTTLTKDPFENNAEKLINSDGNYVINTDLINAPNRYVIIAGPDGNSKRVSTKLSAYIGYLDDKTSGGEEAIDAIIREAAIWKNRLKNWSDKLINKPISPTPFNFMDVIELSDLLTEKK